MKPYRSEFNDPHVQQHRRAAAKRPDKLASNLSDILSKIEKDIDQPTDPMVLILKSNWKEIVGPIIAKHSEPARITGGTLLVLVNHPGFITELIRARHCILMKIQKAYANARIKKIFFSLVTE